MGVTFLVEPIKSPKDHRLYRRLKLDNQLDVLLISDPEIQRESTDHDMCSNSSRDEDQARDDLHCVREAYAVQFDLAL